MALDSQNYYEPGEGEDRLQEGTTDKETIQRVPIDEAPLYSLGSRNFSTRGVTAETLYPRGVGDIPQIGVFRSLSIPLTRAADDLSEQNCDLVVVSGFLSQVNQYKRWRALFDKEAHHSAADVIRAGRKADSAGSVAQIRPEMFAVAHQSMIKDETEYNAIRAELIASFTPEDRELTAAELDKLVAEYVQYLANASGTNPHLIDISTATSVHNLGHSVNVLLREDDQILNMGVGVDIVSPAQSVDFFRRNLTNPGAFENLLETDPTLAEHQRAFGVRTVDEKLMAEIDGNRWKLHQAMRKAGFGGYKGEIGHYSYTPEHGLPSREHAYKQAKAFGYKIN